MHKKGLKESMSKIYYCKQIDIFALQILKMYTTLASNKNNFKEIIANFSNKISFKEMK